ncbi:hypothetical protein JAO71_07505 [Olleya sp. YSTF-M6]|uniref:Uncharacterized protein n=1 Tax=Olleya sediminilitoris TaxID=2795739 RepID=A0ABS1WKK1_9FLAO|nr:hypothetical protein [Olleya sediminilitoris]MBL7559646.1 hypothetical protein [Olleya sediminilitoris]
MGRSQKTVIRKSVRGFSNTSAFFGRSQETVIGKSIRGFSNTSIFWEEAKKQ